jgi:ribonucleoside-diphosphate reductase beta chain
MAQAIAMSYLVAGKPQNKARAGLSAPTADQTEVLMFPRLATYSQIVARLQWDPAAIDLRADARAWPGLSTARRRRLTTLLAGFRVAEDAVAEHLVPFADVAETVDSMQMWIFFLQRRDEDRHALFFDRIAAEVLRLPGGTPAERREAARAHVPPALLELFEVRLPALLDGVAVYHMLLEGAVFGAGQRALLDDLADGALPGVREGVEHVELDERWHVGFGLRSLTQGRDPSLLDDLPARAAEAAAAWGDAVPAVNLTQIVEMSRRRLSVAGLVAAQTAA